MLTKPTYKGLIDLGSKDRDGQEVVVYEHDEGPDQLIDQVRTYSVPAIREAVRLNSEPPWLRWQQLDLETGRIHFRHSPCEQALRFRASLGELGIELLLADEEASPWVPLYPFAEPSRGHRAMIGWTVTKPLFCWRYLQTDDGRVQIEAEWRLEGLPPSWTRAVFDRRPEVLARSGGETELLLKRACEDRLIYRGHLLLPCEDPLPAERRFALEQPLVLVGCDSDDDGPGGADEDGAGCQLDRLWPVTIELLDLRALFGGRVSRLVADTELSQECQLEVLTATEVVLPSAIPEGLLAAVPWELVVSGDRPPTSGSRRWLLSARPQEGKRGLWGEIRWAGKPLGFRFELGDRTAPSAPGIDRIGERKVTVGWSVEPGTEESELLVVTRPQWIPAGLYTQASRMSVAEDYDYSRAVTCRLADLDEHFEVDASSELPLERLHLEPGSWTVRDDRGEEVVAESFGKVGGHVRWRRPVATVSGDNGAPPPSRWAEGSGSVLIVDRFGPCLTRWGAFYAPAKVPWEALAEVAPTVGDRDGVLSLRLRPGVPAVWLSLWGFLSRYDRVQLSFLQAGQKGRRVIGWIAPEGLPCFPTFDDVLLRGLAPLYVVADPESRVLDLQPSEPRPTLRIGRELLRSEGFSTLDIGQRTFARGLVVARGGQPKDFGVGWIPGGTAYLETMGENRELWLAIEQIAEPRNRSAGYLLSWDRRLSWRFRGFFAAPRISVELGRVGRRVGSVWSHSAVVLTDTAADHLRSFTLILDGNCIEWGPGTPSEISEQVTAEQIRGWDENYYMRSDDRPTQLQPFETQIIEQTTTCRVLRFTEAGTGTLPSIPGIRLWEPHPGVSLKDLTEPAVRKLGASKAETVEGESEPAPEVPPAATVRHLDDTEHQEEGRRAGAQPAPRYLCADRDSVKSFSPPPRKLVDDREKKR